MFSIAHRQKRAHDASTMFEGLVKIRKNQALAIVGLGGFVKIMFPVVDGIKTQTYWTTREWNVRTGDFPDADF